MRDLSDSFPPGKTGCALFLQGPPSRFWSDLARGFSAVGWRVEKILISPADALFWSAGPSTRFSGDLDEWRAFFQARLRDNDVTCVFLYADRLPHHRVAINICRRIGVPVYVIENGYLRPDWITCEQGGMGRYSEIPRSADAIQAMAIGLPEPDLRPKYPHKFFQEAWREVAFHLCNGLTPRRFWRYDHDRYYHPAYDYAQYLLKFLRAPWIDDHVKKSCTDLFMNDRAFYFAPLQMQTDYAVRENSDYAHIRAMIKEVIASFARHAPKNSRLLFKSHPHDNGAEGWGRIIRRTAKRHRIGRRVCLIESGPFGSLVAASKGVIVINSTSGLHAIRAFKPVIALGDAVYDMPGLTHQSGLDSFWKKPDPIDMRLVEDFVRVLAHRYQVKGSFFNPRGRRRAVRAIVERITGKIVPSDSPRRTPIAATEPAMAQSERQLAS